MHYVKCVAAKTILKGACLKKKNIQKLVGDVIFNLWG